jgi:hypothetical protein
MRHDATAVRLRSPVTWRVIAFRFVPIFGALSLAWETVHLPLYTIWREASPAENAFAVFHCALGDIAIGVASLLLALVVLRLRQPPSWPLAKLSTLTAAFGVAYTVFSEWFNTSVEKTWTYSELMPELPVTGTGLSPVLQWLILPPLATALSLCGFPRKEKAD